MTWMCDICGYAYEGEDFSIEADDYQCPLCDGGKENFHKRDVTTEVETMANEFFEKQAELK